ncbi:transcriptional regulator with XRE-family HTH domain [Enterococcus rotai]|uniref:helix-turn-helix domain-containing protein n=1 Tax=Enterococcus rotai TaxID=118060 RepID=UPI0033907F0A
MGELNSTKINRVIELQKMLKENKLKANYVAEKSGVTNTTISNLKKDKVNPEKMTDGMLTKLSNFMTSPDNPYNQNTNTRDYYFGQLLAIMELLLANLRSGYGIKQEELESYSKKPVSTFQRMHESIVSGNLATFLDLQDEVMSIVSKFEPSDFTDEPLSPGYLLAYYKKRAELKADKNYFQHIKHFDKRDK